MVQQRRVAVVTGGSAGVGRATVCEFAARGYDVAIRHAELPAWTAQLSTCASMVGAHYR